MHGKNLPRGLAPNDDGTLLQVHEIFYTIQGEGPFSGCPAIFIRFTGCNLRCHFCDTAWDDINDAFSSVDNIVNDVNLLAASPVFHANIKLVVITGGEPMRQNLKPLLQQLVTQGYNVQIETAGTYWQDYLLSPRITIVCSPKTEHVHPTMHTYCEHWKYVIRAGEVSEEDGLPNRPTQLKDPRSLLDVPVESLAAFSNKGSEYFKLLEKYGIPARPRKVNKTIWLSPCDEGNYMETKKNILLVGQLALKFGYRAQVQLHKLLELA